MSLRDPYDPAVRRDDWRLQLFHDQVAERRAERLRAKKMRRAVWLGVALGVFGSIAFYLA